MKAAEARDQRHAALDELSQRLQAATHSMYAAAWDQDAATFLDAYATALGCELELCRVLYPPDA